MGCMNLNCTTNYRQVVRMQGYSFGQRIGSLDFDLVVPRSAGFCLGRPKYGITGRAGGCTINMSLLGTP